MDGNRTGTTTLGQSGPGSNGIEGVLHTSQVFRNKTSHLQIELSVRPRTPFIFGRGV